MKLVNKMFMLLCCACIYVLSNDAFYMVVPVVAVITLSALISLFDRPVYKTAGLALLSALSLFYPVFLYFTPLFLYDVLTERSAPAGFIVLIPLAVHLETLSWQTLVLLFLLSCIAYLTKYYASRLDRLWTDYRELRDDSKEMAFSPCGSDVTG